MRWLFSSVIAVGITFLLTLSSAAAATVVQLDLPRLVDESDVIVVAEVVDTSAELGTSGRVYTTITFNTDDTVKGEPGEEFTIRQVGGTVDDIATHVPGMPHFEPDQRVFLFISTFDERPAVTGLSQGRFDVVTDPDDGTQYVVPRLQGLRTVEPDSTPTIPDDPTAPDAVDPLEDDDTPAAKPQIRNHAALFGQTHEFDAFRQQVELLVDGTESDQ